MNKQLKEIRQPTELEVNNCRLLARGKIGDVPVCEAILQSSYARARVIRKACSAVIENKTQIFPCDDIIERLKNFRKKI